MFAIYFKLYPQAPLLVRKKVIVILNKLNT